MVLNLKKNIIRFLINFIPRYKQGNILRLHLKANSLCKKCRKKELLSNSLNNNHVFVVYKNGKKTDKLSIDGLNIKFKGKNSSVVIHQPIIFQCCNITVCHNSYVEIYPSEHIISNFDIDTANDSKVVIEENFSCCGCSIENHDESKLEVHIGKGCMFSYGVSIRTSDGHAIYDTQTNKIINKPQKGVNIGDHVWIGMKTLILKDVDIPNNCVIGAGAVVNKKFEEENSIIAGVPAKVIKNNINWSRENTEGLNI